MFGLFTAVTSRKPVTPAPALGRTDEYIYTRELAPLNSVFDPEELWGRSDDRSGRFIRNVLLDHPVQPYRARATQIFSQVEILVSDEAVQLDYVTAKQKGVRGLSAGLAELHQKEAGKLSEEGTPIRYRVIACPGLLANQVVIRFGHGVFVPPETGTQARISVEFAAGPDAAFEPIGSIAEGQNVVVLGDAAGACTVAVPNWPFGTDASLVWAQHDGSQAIAYASPLRSLVVDFDTATGLCRIGRPSAADTDTEQVIYLRFTEVQKRIQTPKPTVVALPVATEIGEALAAPVAAPVDSPSPIAVVNLDAAAKTQSATSSMTAASAGILQSAVALANATAARARNKLSIPASSPPAAGPAASAVPATARQPFSPTVPTKPVAPAALIATIPPAPIFASPAAAIIEALSGPPIVGGFVAVPPLHQIQSVKANGDTDKDPTLISMPNAPASSATSDTDGTLIAMPRSAMPTHQLRLVGLLMQRVSAFAGVGVASPVDSFEVGFNALAMPQSADSNACLRLRVDSNDQLFASTAQGETAITPPQRYATQTGNGGLTVDVAPEGLDAYAVAMVRADWNLSHGMNAGSEMRFGREETTLADLRVLDSIHCIRVAREDGTQKGDRLGLSRRAATLTLDGDSLNVRLDSASQLAFVLDENMKLVHRLDSNNPLRTVSLLPGHYLIMSHYVMRFEKAVM